VSDAFLRRAGIQIEAVTFEQAQIARQAYRDFGRGHHPFGHTDILPALAGE